MEKLVGVSLVNHKGLYQGCSVEKLVGVVSQVCHKGLFQGCSVEKLVSWCCGPSEPQRIISGLLCGEVSCCCEPVYHKGLYQGCYVEKLVDVSLVYLKGLYQGCSVEMLVSWWCEPSLPHRIISGLFC